MDLDFAAPAARKRRRRRFRTIAILGIVTAAGGVANIGMSSRPSGSANPDGELQRLAGDERESVNLAIPAPTNSAMAVKSARLPKTATDPTNTKQAEDNPPQGSNDQDTTTATAALASAASVGEIRTARASQPSSQQPEPASPSEAATAGGNNEATGSDSADPERSASQSPLGRDDDTKGNYQTDANWQQLEVDAGDSLAALFREAGLSATVVHEVLSSHERADELRQLHPGDIIAIRTSDAGRLLALRHELSEGETLRLERGADGFEGRMETNELERRVLHSSAVIRSSLFDAGARVGLDDGLLLDLASIFRWDIDFALDIRRGDAFTVIYEAFYQDGERVRNGDILAAEFVNRGEAFRAVRYENDSREGVYYNPAGEAMRKAFLRSPVEFTRVSSDFDRNRMHPTLGERRAHLGTDYAASRGTPIRATGDGRVVHRGWKGGYGRTLVLEHGGRRTTLYAHMAGYANGLGHGDRVRQGQIIGYVGSSGQSTGPHLHYEFRVNGRHRDPQHVDLPNARSIPDRLRADFEEQTSDLLTRLAVYSRIRLVAQGRLGP